MNREDIVKALEICTDGDETCQNCPLLGVDRCMKEVMFKARELILERQVKVICKDAEPWTRRRVLSEAEKCVCGKREQDYGAPEDSFQKIAALWTAYLSNNSIVDTVFSASDVALMLVLLKIARISENPQHMDSWVDGCGYFACGGEIAGKEAQE